MLAGGTGLELWRVVKVCIARIYAKMAQVSSGSETMIGASSSVSVTFVSRCNLLEEPPSSMAFVSAQTECLCLWQLVGL